MLDDRAVRQQQTVRAGYLIAGDGNHSPIRQRVGIGVDGPGQLLTTITAIVEADLNPAGLLDTYDQERRPIGLLTMGQAMARFASRMAPGQGPAVLDDGAVAMGYQYRSRPLRAPPTPTRGRCRRWR